MNILRYMSSTSLDCFVPRNDRKKQTTTGLNLSSRTSFNLSLRTSFVKQSQMVECKK